MDIILSGVSFGYGAEPVISTERLVFAEGSRTVVMGPSGSGKTTLLNLLMGLRSPAGGEVCGVPSAFSAVFQEDRLCESFSAVRNLMLAGIPEDDARRALAELGLGGQEDLPAKSFSGGMKRRTAIARAVLAPGGALFLDEPFRGLDDSARRRAASFILSNLRGRTLIAVSHDADDARLLGGAIMDIKTAQKQRAL